MPYVYGKKWSQKLKILNIIPFYFSKKFSILFQHFILQ